MRNSSPSVETVRGELFSIFEKVIFLWNHCYSHCESRVSYVELHVALLKSLWHGTVVRAGPARADTEFFLR